MENDFYFFNRHFDDYLHQEFTFSVSKAIGVKPYSFAFVLNPETKSLYLAKIYNVVASTTLENRLTAKEVIEITFPMDEFFGIVEVNLKEVNEKDFSKPLSNQQAKIIRSDTIRLNENLHESYFSFESKGYDDNEITPQIIRTFGLAAELSGIDIPLLNEPQILDFDMDNMFGGKVKSTLDGRYYFCSKGGRKILYLQKVHQTNLEKYLGVDMIYNFIDERRLVLVQYKCPQKGKSKFYKSQDKNFPNELERMLKIPGIQNCSNFTVTDRHDLRLCNCPVYIKLSGREIKNINSEPDGFYYPICIWNHLYTNQISVELNEVPHISNSHFTELVRTGLLGSTIKQTEVINEYLLAISEDDTRLKLVFGESERDAKFGRLCK